jgi:RDD family
LVSSSQTTADVAAPLPSADPWRRLMGFVYESIILFGVIWFAGYVFSSLTQYQAQRGNVALHHAFQVFTALVFGLYFSWFWAEGRRTLPMKTLSLDLVNKSDGALSLPAAMVRYCVGLALFLIAMAAARWIHLALVLLVVLPFAYCFIDGQKRSLIDVIAGTRLVLRPVVGKQIRGLG